MTIEAECADGPLAGQTAFVPENCITPQPAAGCFHDTKAMFFWREMSKEDDGVFFFNTYYCLRSDGKWYAHPRMNHNKVGPFNFDKKEAS